MSVVGHGGVEGGWGWCVAVWACFDWLQGPAVTVLAGVAWVNLAAGWVGLLVHEGSRC